MRAKRVCCATCGARGSIANKFAVANGLHPFYLCGSCHRAVIASTDPWTLRAAYLEKATWESARDCVNLLKEMYPI